MNWTKKLGELGVWRGHDDIDDVLARTIEQLEYGTIWLGGSPGSDLRCARRLLDATESVVVATGIVNIWKSDAAELAASYHRTVAQHPGRLLLGIGSGHREASRQRTQPLEATARYLDTLDTLGVPIEDRVIAALGPRMTELARTRSAGTHPYLTVPAQSAQARAALGSGPLVAPELTIVLDPDPALARATARAFLRPYLDLRNYTDNIRRAGYTEHDFEDGGSDELLDHIIAHGEVGQIVHAIRSHFLAGANHVCVQVQPRHDVVRTLTSLSAGWRSEGWS